ncbi:hypothetical protein E2C01_011423 [Portunus trituberculatus]|uniref:Uncharacterized protein n=1 Tax=Portunus trituberculatus TaxID=210409 RepID=A0A5B7DBN7_PORTR|nr:hypothetical protein [Portunus trituberculatus]
MHISSTTPTTHRGAAGLPWGLGEGSNRGLCAEGSPEALVGLVTASVCTRPGMVSTASSKRRGPLEGREDLPL